MHDENSKPSTQNQRLLEASEPPERPATTPMQMLAIALSHGAGMDIIERLTALQERMLARAAEREFNEAMNRAQTALGPIQADLTNPQTKSKYASYAALDRKVRPVYTKEGLSLSFDTGESPLAEHVRVMCFASGFGHTRTYHVDMPADGKGAKGGDAMTKTHATGAAMSYGMRYLVKMIFNIAVGEDDTDGNGAKMSALQERLEWLANAKDLAELQRLFNAAFKEALGMHDTTAMAEIVRVKDIRKKELQ